MFSKPLQPKKGTLFVLDRLFSVFSKPLKLKKGTSRRSPKEVPFSFQKKCPSLSSPKKVPFSFRTGKRYLFRCFPSLSSPKRKVPFSVFSKPLKPKQGTFFGVFRTGKKYLFLCFPSLSSQKKIPFSFRACQASQVKKGTFFVPDLKKVSFSVFSKPLKRKKNTFFVPDRKKVPISSVFSASQAQKNTFFVPDRKKYLFSVFSKPLKLKKIPCFRSEQPEKGTFFGVFQASQAQKKVPFSFRTGKRYLFLCFPSLSRSGPEKGTFFWRSPMPTATSPSLSSPKRVPLSFRTGVFQASSPVAQVRKRYLPHEPPKQPTPPSLTKRKICPKGECQSVEKTVASSPFEENWRAQSWGVSFGSFPPPGTEIFWRTLENQISFRTGKRYLFRCFPSLSSPKRVPFFFRTGKRYLFGCFPSLSSPKPP